MTDEQQNGIETITVVAMAAGSVSLHIALLTRGFIDRVTTLSV